MPGFVAATTQYGLGVASLSFAVPAGTVNGDTINVFITRDTGNAITAPAGFGGEIGVAGFAAFRSTSLYQKVYAGEAGPYVFNFAGADSTPAGICAAYNGTSIAGAPLTARSDLTPGFDQSGSFQSNLAAGSNAVTDTTVLYVGMLDPLNAASADNGVTPVVWTDAAVPVKTLRARVSNLTPFVPAQNVCDLILYDEYVASAAAEPAFDFTETWQAGFTYRMQGGVVQVFNLAGGNPVTASPGVGVGASAPMVG